MTAIESSYACIGLQGKQERSTGLTHSRHGFSPHLHNTAFLLSLDNHASCLCTERQPPRLPLMPPSKIEDKKEGGKAKYGAARERKRLPCLGRDFKAFVRAGWVTFVYMW